MKDKILMKSQFVQVIKDCDKAVIWHSLFGNPKIVSEDTLRFIDVFSSPQSIGSVLNKYDIGEGGEIIIQDAITNHYLIGNGFDERKFLARRMQKSARDIINGSCINKIELIMSEECNFRCVYCLHFGNLGTSDRIKNPRKFMTFEIAKKAMDKYMAIQQQNGKSVASVNFGGGEPLIVWPVILQVLEYCHQKYGKEFTFRFTINTNASLITPEIAKKLKEYIVVVASSIDGLKKGNDLVRLTKSGKGTFDVIIRGFENLIEQGCPPADVAVTINDQNFSFLDERIIDWAIEQHMNHVRINPDVINMVEMSVEDIVVKLLRIRRYAISRGVNVTGSWSRPAGNLNDSALNTPVAFCKGLIGESICVSPSEKIYPCGYSNAELGTLDSVDSLCIYGGAYHHFVVGHQTGTKELCKGCMIEGQCGGGCEITQEFAHAKKIDKVEKNCILHRRMTYELLLEQLQENHLEVDFEKSPRKGGNA